MLSFVQDTKYANEIIPLSFNFKDILLPSEVITGLPVVTITLFSGLDSNPSSLLYLGVIIKDQNLVEQKIQKGIPGNIYNIETTIQTSLGNTYIKECYLAIIYEPGTTKPALFQYYFTSELYPYILTEKLSNYITPQWGHLLESPYWIEELKNNILPLAANLQSVLLFYNNYPPESLNNSILPLSGSIQLVLTFYNNYAPEKLKVSILPLSGSIQLVLIFYSNYIPESLSNSILPLGATLT